MQRFIVVVFAVVISSCLLAREVNAKNINSDKRKTVVLDPGHGGHHNGAQGPNGTFEKSVTLKLAKMITTELAQTYHVVLTRSDDYWMDSHTRTDVANHSKADLFISIHAGGAFLHQATQTFIYYYRQFADQNIELGNDRNRSVIDRDIQGDWPLIHERYQTTSRLLAKLVKSGLDKNPAFINSEIKGAPIVVLEGVDMPAILIEIGYITNPKVENSLRDINTLSDIARGIKRGVDDFFEPAQH